VVFEQFGVLLGGLAAGAMMANRGVLLCVYFLAFASGDWKIGISFFSSLEHLHTLRMQHPFFEPDKLSRPRTRKSRLGRWRKFLLFNACLFFPLTFPFLSVNSSMCVRVYLGYIFLILAKLV
jgi:hypothetical protein